MSESSGTTLAQRLKQAAKAAGTTSAALGAKLGVTPSAVRSWWAGRNEPSADHLARYAVATGVSVGYLVTGKEAMRYDALEMAEMMIEVMDTIVDAQGGDPAIYQTLAGKARLRAHARQKMAADSDQTRETISQAAGGSWELLTEAEKREILQEIEDRVRGRREARDNEDERSW